MPCHNVRCCGDSEQLDRQRSTPEFTTAKILRQRLDTAVNKLLVRSAFSLIISLASTSCLTVSVADSSRHGLSGVAFVT